MTCQRCRHLGAESPYPKAPPEEWHDGCDLVTSHDRDDIWEWMEAHTDPGDETLRPLDGAPPCPGFEGVE